jgi:phytoene synthase
VNAPQAKAPQATATPPALSPPRGSSFYLAMRILPGDQRRAMFAIYGFCRAVDDIADDSARPRQTREDELRSWRAAIEAMFAGAPTPAGLAELAFAVRAYDLQRADFLAIIDGMEMDVAADMRAPDWATLDLYCDRVACAVGRLSTRIFGLEPAAGALLAEHLGRALQLTNILRDLDEDCALGRLYLPREALEQAGVAAREPARALASPEIDAAARPLVEEAQRRFRLARELMDSTPRALVRAPQLMAAVYQGILQRLAARGFAPPRAPVRPPLPRLAIALLRYGLF